MKKGKYAEIEKVRKELLNIEGVKAVVITDANGKILGSGVPFFAQAVTEWMEQAELTAEDINADPPDEITLATKSERIIVMRAGPNALVAIRAKPEANQQLVSVEMLRAAEAIRKLTRQPEVRKWQNQDL